MKKWYFAFFSAVFLLLFFAVPKMVPAQGRVDFKKAYEDYLFKLDVYRKAYGEYSQARDFYLQEETLGLKEAARGKTFAMLVARDDLISVYLSMLRIKLLDVPDHPGSQKGDIVSDIPGEVKWYTDHQNTFNKENDSLETLFTKAEETTEEYDAFTNRLVYKTISRIAISRFIDMKIQHENIYKAAKVKVEEKSGSDRTLYNRWIVDIDDGFQKITNVENEVQTLLTDFAQKPGSEPKEIYKESVAKLVEAQKSFIAINGFLSEMLTALGE